MKKQSFFPLSLLPLLAVTLFNCDNSTEPQPGSQDGTSNGISIATLSPVSGKAGDRVVITGSGFSSTLSNNIVKFGGESASVDSASANRLIIRVPKDAEKCKIEVLVDGKKATCPIYFDVNQILPAFSTGNTANEMYNLTSGFARIASKLDLVGSRTIVQHGHAYSHSGTNPMVYDRSDPSFSHPESLLDGGHTQLGAVSAADGHPYNFISYLIDLRPDTDYTVRAYVTTKAGITYYGPASTFRTQKK